MRKLTQPWKLCRSVGSQPVGNVAGPRWTEAGIAAQVIPALPSSRTFALRVMLTAGLLIGAWIITGVPTHAICYRNSSGLSRNFKVNVENIATSRVSNKSVQHTKRCKSPANVELPTSVSPLPTILWPSHLLPLKVARIPKIARPTNCGNRLQAKLTRVLIADML